MLVCRTPMSISGDGPSAYCFRRAGVTREMLLFARLVLTPLHHFSRTYTRAIIDRGVAWRGVVVAGLGCRPGSGLAEGLDAHRRRRQDGSAAVMSPAPPSDCPIRGRMASGRHLPNPEH
jgi:hypothetical protein